MRPKFLSENLNRRDHMKDLRCRYEDNIRMDLTEIGWESVDWMHLIQDSDQWQVLVTLMKH